MPWIIDPKPDKPDKSVVLECLCRNCGIKFGFTPSEAKSAYYRDIGGGGDSYWEINCPGCGSLRQLLK